MYQADRYCYYKAIDYNYSKYFIHGGSPFIIVIINEKMNIEGRTINNVIDGARDVLMLIARDTMISITLHVPATKLIQIQKYRINNIGSFVILW